MAKKVAGAAAETLNVKDHRTGATSVMSAKQYEQLRYETLNRDGKSIYRYTVGEKAKVADTKKSDDAGE